MASSDNHFPAAAQASAPRPLRVLHFVSGGFSGATQVAIDLCGDSSEQETLLVLRGRIMNPTERVRALRERGLAVEVVPRWSHWATIAAVRRLCQTWKPDVFVAHGFSEHLWGRYAALLSGVPHIVQVEHNTRERYGRWRLWQSLWLARRTDSIVGVSYAVRDALVERGHPPALCTVIHNGIDLPRWTKGQPWEARENAIVMPARFARQKDHDTLIRAMAVLRGLGHTPPRCTSRVKARPAGVPMPNARPASWACTTRSSVWAMCPTCPACWAGSSCVCCPRTTKDWGWA